MLSKHLATSFNKSKTPKYKQCFNINVTSINLHYKVKQWITKPSVILSTTNRKINFGSPGYDHENLI